MASQSATVSALELQRRSASEWVWVSEWESGSLLVLASASELELQSATLLV